MLGRQTTSKLYQIFHGALLHRWPCFDWKRFKWWSWYLDHHSM